MTRDAAKKLGRIEIYRPKTYPQKIRWKDELIDAIYDSFEQQLCNNCIFDYCGCSVQDSILQIEPTATFDTFGCNSFESKEKPCVYVNPKSHF